MNEKCCGECRKLRTNECCRPDHCVQHGYCDFAYHRLDKQCPLCGVDLFVQKTEPIKRSNVVYTTKICPVCGYRVKVTFDFTILSPVKPPGQSLATHTEEKAVIS